jgi:hypothetical protein
MASKYQYLAVVALWGSVTLAAVSGPADYVHTPTVQQGEREVDFRYGTSDLTGANDDQQAVIGLGYGVTDFWFTEAYIGVQDSEHGGWRIEGAEWENKFQLTETGKYPVTIGFLTELEFPWDGGDLKEFRFGPLVQGDIGKVQLNGNLLFETLFGGDRHTGGEDIGDVLEVRDEDEQGEESGTLIGYEVQAKYRWRRDLDFGVQGFGEMGTWNHWEPTQEQSHRFGPAIFGKVNLSGQQVLQYNAAILFGLTDASPNDTFRVQIEYEF